jgi:hypothetical protein
MKWLKKALQSVLDFVLDAFVDIEIPESLVFSAAFGVYIGSMAMVLNMTLGGYLLPLLITVSIIVPVDAGLFFLMKKRLFHPFLPARMGTIAILFIWPTVVPVVIIYLACGLINLLYRTFHLVFVDIPNRIIGQFA